MSTKKENFTVNVLHWICQIPKGSVASYQEIAILAGAPGAARAVGTIARKNKDKTVPCHRVIKSDGSLGGYNGNLGKKEALLRKEGIVIKNTKVQNR